MAKVPAAELNQLTWAVFWRFMLLSIVVTIIASFLTGFVLGFIWAMMGADYSSPTALFWYQAIGFIAGWGASFLVLRLVLRHLVEKKIGGFIILPLSMIVAEEKITPSPSFQTNAVSEA